MRLLPFDRLHFQFRVRRLLPPVDVRSEVEHLDHADEAEAQEEAEQAADVAGERDLGDGLVYDVVGNVGVRNEDCDKSQVFAGVRGYEIVECLGGVFFFLITEQ